MNVSLPGPYEGHHAAAARLAEAIREATRATLDLDDLSDAELDSVAGGAREHDVYWASADFLADWRRDPAAA